MKKSSSASLAASASSSSSSPSKRHHVQISEERTTLFPSKRSSNKKKNRRNDVDDEDDDEDDYGYGSAVAFQKMKPNMEAMAAEKLSMRLLQISDDDSDEENRILRESLNLTIDDLSDSRRKSRQHSIEVETKNQQRIYTMISMSFAVIAGIIVAWYAGTEFIGPPNQPVGPYRLIERQEGENFFEYYNFYEGPDSVGSNGYNNYVSQLTAQRLGIVNVTYEPDDLDVFHTQNRRNLQQLPQQHQRQRRQQQKKEPFIYMSSAPTKKGPRESIRLEGKRRFNRGLFIIDLRHMPAGCGVWPAFWLTDEANWPVNGEIDIVEGVNYQSEAKTALHSTKGCDMDDVPIGLKTGSWDTAIGIPDKDTGIPDMTVRYATNCFVYYPHQWLNQGCVAVDTDGDSLGVPLNEKGGGVFVLEWDPSYHHIRTWVFSPHSNVPDNLVDAIRTASEPLKENQIMPDPELWPLPYGYFPIGDQTNCPSSHFRNMRLVLNMAFCGSVSGNRYFMDCKEQFKKIKTCNEWVKSNPIEIQNEAYWKIRGVYVYERDWQKTWVHGQ